MYQNNIVELYKVIEQGELEQVKEIMAGNRVDFSALNGHETNIVSLLLNKRIVKDRDAKLRILISAGALPEIDQNNNFLMQLVLAIEDIAIRNEILATVAQTYPIFNEYYPESHVQAIQGVKPEKDRALAIDGYGLYPIHYAIAAETVTGSWFESQLYDITKTIETGLYQGTSIAWWLFGNKTFDDFNRLIQGFSLEQRYEVLKAAPQNPQNINQGLSVASLLVDQRFDDFDRLTQGLSPEQCYEILKAAPQNPQNINQGLSVASLLLVHQRFDDFDRLTQGLSPEQCYEILKAAPQNPQRRDQGYSVAWLLTYRESIDEFNHLTQNLTPEQCYEILKAALQNPQHVKHGISVAWRLLEDDNIDEFNHLTQNLTPEQCYEILKAAAQNPQHEHHGISAAWWLLDDGCYQEFNRLTQNLTPEQCYEILKAAPQNPQHVNYGMSVAWMLLVNKKFDDFTRLTRDLTPEQYFEILKSAPLDDNHDFYMQTVFVLLLNNKSYNLLLNFTKGLSKEQLKQLLSHPLYKKAPNSNNVEQYSTVIKVMVESHSDFAYKLFNPYTYEDLIPWYNSIESNAIESQFIAYLCFSKLHEILHVRFTNPPETLTEEYKEDISGQLEDLFGYYQQILFQSSYYKEVADKLGMLLAQSSETIFRETVIKLIEKIGNEDCLHINQLAGNYVLEGFAHTLRIIGHTDTANARALGIIHAQAEKKANELAEENEKLKEEIAALKQPPESSREELNNSQRNEKRPSIFAAVESYPVKKSKSEQAEQPPGLKGERQLR